MPNSVLKRHVLVLNKLWVPIGTATVRDVIGKLTTNEKGIPKARIIDPENFEMLDWEDWAKLMPQDDEAHIQSCSTKFKIPEVIIFTNTDKLPRSIRGSFNRKNLFRRDCCRCQYCGKQMVTEELTIDHVIPRSKGGPTSWENCVLACVNCNSKKANRSLEASGMKLLKKPVKPEYKFFINESTRCDSWKKFLDEMYWQVPLH